jgi:hypothetical protein
MSRKLNIQNLENRIAPGYGLFSFLSGLAAEDSEFGNLFNSVVDGETGDVDVDGAVGAWNSVGGSEVSSVRDSFTLSDDLVISDATAANILSIFGK